MRLPAYLTPLRQETFRAVWSANLVSNSGQTIMLVGAAWLMTTLTDSAELIALVQSSTALPVMLFALPSGAIADNFDRRRVMIFAQCHMLVVSVLMAASAYLGLMTPWLLLGFVFLLGCGIALNNPSWQASVRDLVPREVLPSAVALNSVGFNLTRSVAPAIGGLIVGGLGAAVSFLVNALGYLPILLVLLRWKPPVVANQLPREAITAAMAAGLRYVSMSPDLLKTLVRSFMAGFANISIVALLPVVVRDALGGGPLTYGLMLGCYGTGAVIAGTVISPWQQRMSPEQAMRAALLSSAAGGILAAITTSPLLAGIGFFLCGVGWLTSMSRLNVTVQFAAPRWVVGRALSMHLTIAFGGMASGSWLWGQLAETYGASASILVSVVAMIAGAAIGLVWALPDVMAIDNDQLDSWREPDLALEIRPRSGPIRIVIEYIIREEDTEAFLQVLAERRRIRRRDGARHWTLARDLGNPQRWYETYHTPTWIEYIRHNRRRTQADTAITDRIRALHAGPEPPRVTRMIERPTKRFAPLEATRSPLDLH